MTEIEKTLFDLIRAAASGSRSEIPATVDPVTLYRIVRRLHLGSFLWDPASRLPASDVRTAWENDRHTAMMKDLMQTEEIEAISEALSGAGIRFAFLKGAELKRLWGDSSFRYMGDLDLYYEGDDAALRRALEGIGYTAERFGTRDFSHHFVFTKEPWFVLEPHFALLDPEDPFRDLLDGLFDRATPDPTRPGRYRLSPEDLYLHCLIHLRKHLADSGIGVRSFLDFAFLLREYPDLPERARVREVLDGAGLSVMESRVLHVARLFFDPAATPDAEDELEISSLFGAGLFGTFGNEMNNRLATERANSRCPRLRLFLKCAFPPLLSMAHRRFRAPLSWMLYPFFWFRRTFLILFSRKRRKKTGETFRVLSASRDDAENGARELRYFGLSPDGDGGREDNSRD